ncbi:MAG: GreA/GreB family elongation factor [Verrucomicrobia bacterium]|nr:GreA/GreB family elongation factor [Verrucomicrobiota bacterium]
MSKAFTREDDVSDLPVLPPLISPLPPGATNYLTADGAERLRAQLAGLLDGDRPALVTAAAKDAEGKRELAQLDQRIRYLQQSLASAEIVGPSAATGKVQFGSTVTVKDRKGVESSYRIVGVDEADFARNEVSWLAPIARALMNATVGQRVPFKFPTGATELEIVKIE